MNGAAEVDVIPPPILTTKELARVFERHISTSTPRARLSFHVQNWEGMDGDFIARMIGDGMYSPPRTMQIKFYALDGSSYHTANVSTNACKSVQWYLDGRPVYFKIKSMATYTNATVNPNNGHLTGCSCIECAPSS